MAKRVNKQNDAEKPKPKSVKRKSAPAKTLEARENQLISRAVDLAEKQLEQGTASAQVITHFLKLGTTKERIEKEIKSKESELLTAKTEALKSAKKVEELYANALDAMRAYAGAPVNDDH